MAKYLVKRTPADVAGVQKKGDPLDSRAAAWYAIKKGGEVIADIQKIAARKRKWLSLADAMPLLNEPARRLLEIREQAIDRMKRAPHHARGFRPSSHIAAANARPKNALCLVSGHLGQEIPGLVGYDRVVVDAEHMDQALGPATAVEIFKIRKAIGEHVYISTNVSESPQLVRTAKGELDPRATASLTASKVITAIQAGADVVKVGYANLDITKRDLRSESVLAQMKLVRKQLDDAVKEKILVTALNQAGRYPLISVFFPEMGIDSNGERPYEIAEKGIDLTAKGGWQGILIDTYEKYTGKTYKDFYSIEDTRKLAQMAHERGIEYWIAGSIAQPEVAALVKCKVDLICFGGAARHASGVRRTKVKGKQDESIKRPLVEKLVQAFEKNDRPAPAAVSRRGKSRRKARTKTLVAGAAG